MNVSGENIFSDNLFDGCEWSFLDFDNQISGYAFPDQNNFATYQLQANNDFHQLAQLHDNVDQIELDLSSEIFNCNQVFEHNNLESAASQSSSVSNEKEIVRTCLNKKKAWRRWSEDECVALLAINQVIGEKYNTEGRQRKFKKIMDSCKYYLKHHTYE